MHRPAASPDEVWAGLSRAQRAQLTERRIELCWFDPSTTAGEQEITPPARRRRLLLEAFLAATGDVTSEDSVRQAI